MPKTKGVTASRPVAGSVAGQRKKIGDEAVRARTGKGWKEWFRIIDAAGGRTMDHKAIVAVLTGHGAGDWWRQMVAVGYEQARGLRKKHEKPDGFSVSASKTIAAPVGELFRAWSDPRARGRWLPDPLQVRKATADRSLRITWGDGTNVDVNLYSKGPAKSQVAVEHARLRSEREATGKKTFWGEALERLKARLEG
jgi:uncharacterized protein YndB with AHSA1/START domain